MKGGFQLNNVNEWRPSMVMEMRKLVFLFALTVGATACSSKKQPITTKGDDDPVTDCVAAGDSCAAG